MSDIVIRVESLGKRYHLSHQQARGQRFGYQRFSDVLLNAAKVPFQKLRSTRNMPSVVGLPPSNREDFWALKDVSFEVKRGEVVGVIGRNGAGKSTLLKILSRITEPTTGRIEIDGRIASLLEVGTGFHPELTGRENIFLNGAILGMHRAEIRRKFDEIVAFAEVERFLDTPVKHYSSGMYVRLAFAVAAHLEPEILIVDEVLAVGDTQFQEKCLGKMREVSRSEGRTIVFVSHNLAAVSALCRKGILLRNGQVAAVGPIANIISEYSQISVTDATCKWRGYEGDATLGLTEMSIEASEVGYPFRTSQSLSVNMTIKVGGATTGLICGFRLYSIFEGEIMYKLYDDNPGAKVIDSIGRYALRFEVPANTLSEGRFGIGVALGIHNIKACVLDSQPRLWFDVINVDGVGRRFIVPNARGYMSLWRPDWKVNVTSI